MVDYWAHAHADDPKLYDEIVDEDFDADLDAFEAEAVPIRKADPEPEPPSPDDGGEGWDTVVEDHYS